MKRITAFILFAGVFFASCEQTVPETKTVDVNIHLTYGGEAFRKGGVNIGLASGDSSFDAITDEDGSATFSVLTGVYSATVSFKESVDGKLLNYNGTATIAVTESCDVDLALSASGEGQLIIKELYNGGCMDDSGAKNYQMDKYMIIYNNSDTEVDASKMCIAMAQVNNTVASNNYKGADGQQTYTAEGWVPASYSIWWFQDGTEVKIPAYSQIVVAINGAIDHTKTYSNSVDLSKADYCMYDLESGFTNASYYPAPAASIPESHYMKTYLYGQGNAWPFPMLSAAPYIIMPETDIKAFLNDPLNFDNKSTNLSGNFAHIPQSWVLDALDVWSEADETKFYYRFPPTVNTGYVVYVSKLGYSIYRNVDKERTEAIAGNEGKLVYNYSGAAYAESSDPSGIDAEASIANGARIVYSNTNNSTADFHVRRVPTVKK